MIPRKLVELTIRSLPLLVLPILIAPTAVLLLLGGGSTEYRSRASIWIEDSELEVNTLGSDLLRGTAASRLQRVLEQLIYSEAFQEDIAIEAGLIDVEAPAPEEGTLESLQLRSLLAEVGRVIQIRSSGPNVVDVVVTTADPALAPRLAGAVVSQYEARARQEIDTRLDTAVLYYTQQINVASGELFTRERALTTYLSANPGAPEASPVDEQYLNLLTRQRSQQDLVNNLENALQQSYLSRASATAAFEAEFSPLDPPTIPIAPLPTSTTTTYGLPLLGLGLGVFVAAAYLWAIYTLDHSIRSSEDLTPLGLAYLGYVPTITAGQNQTLITRVGSLWRRDPTFARRLAASIAVRSTTEEGARR